MKKENQQANSEKRLVLVLSTKGKTVKKSLKKRGRF